MQKATIRKTIRQQRRSLTKRQREVAGRAVAQTLSRSGLLRRGVRVGAFLSQDGELELVHTIHRLWLQGGRCYLPLVEVNPCLTMKFARFRPQTRLSPNRFGILEPVTVNALYYAPRKLDVVLVPLVAFDRAGNRLGMGGGFYDRAFAFLRRRSVLRKPLLIGVAYDFQQVEHLPADPWDVPLAGVVTPTKLIRFK